MQAREAQLPRQGVHQAQRRIALNGYRLGVPFRLHGNRRDAERTDARPAHGRRIGPVRMPRALLRRRLHDKG